ncbi:hypothetical protein SDC9_83991 [bioreactor metagenome]|uniref:Uncharacterized protein n=1 Tax=bioreactor metagenome TaxID=1076179 RepID=A0A644Z914_9ZZZZ
MPARAAACRRIADAPRFAPCQRHQFGHRARGAGGGNCQNARKAPQQRDGCEVVQCVIGQALAVQRCVDGVRADVGHVEGIAVGRGVLDEFRADDAVGPRAVVHDDVAPRGCCDLPRNQA